MKEQRDSWDDYFMKMAALASERSTCLRAKVGAVAVKNNHILATGYNGAPSGQPHCGDESIGFCIREELNVPSGERHEICRGVHAEQNLICQAAMHGTSLFGATVYCTHKPCSICEKLLISIGIKEVIHRENYPRVCSSEEESQKTT